MQKTRTGSSSSITTTSVGSSSSTVSVDAGGPRSQWVGQTKKPGTTLNGKREDKGKARLRIVRNDCPIQGEAKVSQQASAATNQALTSAGSKSKLPVPDYSAPEAPYSLRIDPITGRGPMHVDSRDFTSATSYIMEGAARNKNQFWKMWAEKYPETMSAENLQTIAAKKAPKVDTQWVRHFPEHQSYMDDILIHHHIEHGNLTTALPRELHGTKPGNSMFHTNLGGIKKND